VRCHRNHGRRTEFLLHGRTADLVNVAGKRSSFGYLNAQLNAIPGVVDGAFFLREADERRHRRRTPGRRGGGPHLERRGAHRTAAPAHRPGFPAAAAVAGGASCRATPRANLPQQALLSPAERHLRAGGHPMTPAAHFQHRSELHIAADHPALRRTFPGFPDCCPGAVLLDEALHEIARSPPAST
jgi:hypothetical protein